MGSLLLGCLFFAVIAPADMTITFDIKAPTYIDQSKSSAFPNLGYAGSISDEDPRYAEEFFRRSPDRTWEVFKGAGARLVKVWEADWRWARDKAMAYDVFAWRKKHGVKVLLCIENSGRTINDARRRILGYVQWIIDNGFKDQVAGFELGNEPYWGQSPEAFAERWAEIVPCIKEMWPEVNIGFAVAEYRAGDPDIEAVRRRLTAVDQWFKFGDSEWGMRKINQWSGRFVSAFSNCLHHCSHIIYHFYGGFGPYGCTYNGIRRIRRFAQCFPEVKDKKVWITEWRFTSDFDLTSQQSFQIALFDALYMLMIVCQPEVEGICAHQCGTLSGGFYIATGDGKWKNQRIFGLGQSLILDPDWTGRPRLEVGPVGPVFKLFNEALLGHPHVLARGRRCEGSITDGKYDQITRVWDQSGEGPVEWVLLANAERTSVALMVCNCDTKPFMPPLETVGCSLGRPHYWLYRSKREDVTARQMPGEPRLSWEEEYDGKENEIVIPGKTIATVVFPVKKEVRQ